MIPPRHIPGLVLASAFTFGGLMPFFNAENAIKTFGLPDRIAKSAAAQSTFTIYSARMTAIGMAMFTFYAQGKYTAMDTMLVCCSYMSLVDGYICWKENVPQKAVMRVFFGGLTAAWGLIGGTAGM